MAFCLLLNGMLNDIRNKYVSEIRNPGFRIAVRVFRGFCYDRVNLHLLIAA